MDIFDMIALKNSAQLGEIANLIIDVTNPPNSLQKMTGDGSDESTKLDAIINYISNIGGGVVYFPYGTFYAKNINLCSNIILDGKGVLKTHSSAVVGDYLLKGDGVSRIGIKGIIIDGNKGVVPGTETSGVTLIQLNNSNNIYINCDLQNNGYIAISASNGCSNIKIRDCDIVNTDCGFVTQGTSNKDIIIKGCYIDSGTSEGISLYANNCRDENVNISNCIIKNKVGAILLRNTKDFTISNVIVDTCTGAIGFDNQGAGLIPTDGTISNLVAKNVGSGIDGCCHNTVMHAKITAVNQCGIWIKNKNENPKNNTIKAVISDCNTALTDSACIRLENCIRCKVENSRIFDSRTTPLNYAGIQLNGSSSLDNMLVGNSVTEGTYKTLIQSGVTGTMVIGNSSPITDQGTGTMFSSNFNVGGIDVLVTSSTISIPPGREFFNLSASNPISVTSITAGRIGQRVTFKFYDSNITFVDGSNLKLNGDITGTGDDTITLICDGTNWYETARSVN